MEYIFFLGAKMKTISFSLCDNVLNNLCAFPADQFNFVAALFIVWVRAVHFGSQIDALKCN